VATQRALEAVEEALVEVVEDLEAAVEDLEAAVEDLEAVGEDLEAVGEDLVVFMLAMALEAVLSSDVDLDQLLACIRGCYADHTTMTITIITELCYLKHNYSNRRDTFLGQTDFILFKIKLLYYFIYYIYYIFYTT
jgi:hypothetical protein